MKPFLSHVVQEAMKTPTSDGEGSELNITESLNGNKQIYEYNSYSSLILI